MRKTLRNSLRLMRSGIALSAILLTLNGCANFSVGKTIKMPERKSDMCLYYNYQDCQVGDITCVVNNRNFACLCTPEDAHLDLGCAR